MWYLTDNDGNDIRIFALELNDESKQILPRLHPLDNSTIVQVFGRESSIYKLKCKVVGYDDLDKIKLTATDGDIHTLKETTSSGTVASGMFNDDLYVKDVSANRENTLAQTLRPDLDCYAPVFTVNLTLYKDEH